MLQYALQMQLIYNQKTILHTGNLDYHKSITAQLKDQITGQPITSKYNPSTFAYDISDVTAPPPLIDDGSLGRPADSVDLEIAKKTICDRNPYGIQ